MINIITLLFISSGEGLLDCFRTVPTPYPICDGGDTSPVAEVKEDGGDGVDAEVSPSGDDGTQEQPPQEQPPQEQPSQEQPPELQRIPSYKLSPSKHAHVTAVERFVFNSCVVTLIVNVTCTVCRPKTNLRDLILLQYYGCCILYSNYIILNSMYSMQYRL